MFIQEPTVSGIGNTLPGQTLTQCQLGMSLYKHHIMDMADGLSSLILLVLSSSMLFQGGYINGSWTQEATPPVKEEARKVASVQ